MDWLAEISIKWILIAIGTLMLALALARLAGRRDDAVAIWIIENLQVVVSVVVVVFLLIRPFLFQAFYIPSGSMEPTLKGPPEIGGSGIGDRLIVDKLIYWLSAPKRLDIVVFRAPPEVASDEREFIKRLIALPGEGVEVVPPRLRIDGHDAVRLTEEEQDRPLLPVAPGSLPPRLAGGGTELAARAHGFSSAPLQVVAQPNPQVRFDPYWVEINGTRSLDDPSGRIRADHDLRPLGADPGVSGTLYSIEGSPRLLVLRGEKLTYEPGYVSVSGRRLVEPYLAEPPAYAMSPRRLGPQEYFMMGDNRNNSNDSHAWGPLRRDRIIGRAEVIFWPPGRMGVIHWWLLAVIAGAVAFWKLLRRVVEGIQPA